MGIDRQELFEVVKPLMALADVFDPAPVKLLKGKSCFHLKRADEELFAHVRGALERGFAFYRERGWLPA